MNSPTPPADSEFDDVRGTVLCIEDNPLNMLIIENLLKRFPGVTVSQAMTGCEGVRRALAEAPDLILLDMNLPDIDGLEVVRQLCDQISTQHLSVVLVTADSFSINVVKAMSLGAREYWVKPLSIDRLRKDLPRALRRAQAGRGRSERG
ncbi:MAG: response regulator [Burkholderiales bacterium]